MRATRRAAGSGERQSVAEWSSCEGMGNRPRALMAKRTRKKFAYTPDVGEERLCRDSGENFGK